MAVGGARPGSGRKMSAKNVLTLMSVEKAREEGILPHEWLLKVTRGEAIDHIVTEKEIGSDGIETLVTKKIKVYPDFETRVDAAKACCQFFAPRLSAIQVRSTNAKGIIEEIDEVDLDAMLIELREDIKDKKRKSGVTG